MPNNQNNSKKYEKFERKKTNKKNTKNVKNGQKILKFQKVSFFRFFLFIFVCLKKCSPLSFPILRGRDSTRVLQYTPFQNPVGVVWVWRTNKRKSSCLIVDFKNFWLFLSKIPKKNCYVFLGAFIWNHPCVKCHESCVECHVSQLFF